MDFDSRKQFQKELEQFPSLNFDRSWELERPRGLPTFRRTRKASVVDPEGACFHFSTSRVGRNRMDCLVMGDTNGYCNDASKLKHVRWSVLSFLQREKFFFQALGP